MGAKFLCCLPLRLGVSLFTIAQFLVAGAFSGLVFFVAFAPETNLEWFSFAKLAKTPLIVVGSVYAFVGFVGLLGFLGAMFKKTGLISTYLVVLWISFFIQLATSVWGVVVFLRLRNLGTSDTCDDQLREYNLEDADAQETLEIICDGLERLQKIHPAVPISVVVAAAIVSAYVIYVGHSFLGRLKDKKHEKAYARSSVAGGSGPTYVSVVNQEAHPLTVPHQYPYSDSSNAFGHTKGGSTGYTPVAASRA